jgi:hypothetical protein
VGWGCGAGIGSGFLWSDEEPGFDEPNTRGRAEAMSHRENKMVHPWWYWEWTSVSTLHSSHSSVNVPPSLSV